MINPDKLKDLLAQSAYSPLEKLLICLAVEPLSAKAVKQVRTLAVGAGLRKAKEWNISKVLGSAKSLAARTTAGWELTTDGLRRVAELVGPSASSPAPKVAATLRHHLQKISSEDTKSFVEEAVLCLEQGLYRAAAVLSWVGAVAVLYDHVVANHLSAFNAQAALRDRKWKTAKNKDDLARMRESQFLLVLEDLSLIGKSVKQELETCLQLRNACGHPSSLQVGETKTSAHVESLLLNVFAKY